MVHEIGAVRASASLDATAFEAGVRNTRSSLRVLEGGFQETSREAVRSIEGMASAWSKGGAKTDQAVRRQIELLTGVDTATKNTSATTKAWVAQLSRQAQSFDRLRSSLDPVFASSKRYEATVKQIEGAVRSGIVSQEEGNRVLDQAAQKYLGLVPAAEQAARAQEKAASKARELRDTYEATRASVDPLYASSRQYEAVQRQMNEAVSAGAVSQKEASLVLDRAATQYLGAGNAVAAYGKSARVGTFQTANLAAQFNDIGVMLAAGQNPFMLAVQQGTQVSQVLNQMGGKTEILRGLSAGFMSMISPVSLATIGIIAGGAALLQWGLSAIGANEDADALSKTIEELDRALSAVDKQLDLSKKGFADLRAEFYGSEEGIRSLINAQRDFDLGEVIQQAEKLHQSLEASYSGSFYKGSRVEQLQAAFGLLRGETRNLAADLDALGKAEGLTKQLEATRHIREHFLAMVGSQEDLTGSRAEFYKSLLLSEAALSRALAKQKQVEGSVDAATQAMIRQHKIYGNSRIEAEKMQMAAAEIIAKYERQADLQSAIAAHGKDSSEVEQLKLDAALRTAEALIEQEGLSGAVAQSVREAAIAAYDTEVNAAAAADALKAAEAAAKGLASAIAAAAGFSANLEGGVRILEAEVRALEQGADAAVASGLEAKRIRAENLRDAQIAAGQDRLIADAQLALDMATIDRQGELIIQKKALAKANREAGSSGAAASRNSLAGILQEIAHRRKLLSLTGDQRAEYEAIIQVQRRLGKEASKVTKAQIDGLADQLVQMDKLQAEYDRAANRAQDISGQITDALFDPDSAGDAAREMFQTFATEFTRNKIVLPIVGQNLGTQGSVSAVAGAGGSGGGLLGGAGNLLGLGGGGGWLSGAAQGVWSGLGGVLSGGGLGSSFANLGGLIAGTSSGLGALGAALPALGIAIAGITLLVKGFSREYKGSGLRGHFGAEGFDGEQFSFYKGGVFRSDRTDTKPFDVEFEAILDESIVSMTQGLRDMADVLDLNSDAINKFIAADFQIWTNDMDQASIQAAFEDQMLIAANGMAELILTTEKFSQIGENAFETLTRLSTSLMSVNNVMDLLDGKQFKSTLGGGSKASDLIDQFGGADQFTATTTSYWQTYYSQAEQHEELMNRLADQFDSLNMTMPETREGFRDLVEAQRLGTTEGREAYAALLGLSGAFSELVPATTEVETGLQGVTEATGNVSERLGLLRQLYTLQGRETELRTLQLSQIDEGNRRLQERIWRLEDEAAVGREAEGLRSQILQLRGREARLRELELAALDPANQALQQRIYALQDEQAALEAQRAVRDERQGLREELWGVLGRTEQLRARELAGLDSSNRALQERIWRLEEESAVADERQSLQEQLWQALGRTDRLRKRELAGLDASNRALQERIWRLEDEAVLMERLRDGVSAAMGAVSDAVGAEIDKVRDNAQTQLDRLSGELSEASTRSAEARSSVIGFINDIETGSVGAFRRMRDQIAQALDDRGPISIEQELVGYKRAQAQIIDFATGQAFTEDQLETALSGIKTDSSRFFSSYADYAFDTAQTTQTLRSLEAVTEGQLSEAEQQVVALRELYEVSEEGFTSLEEAVAAMEMETAKASQLEREISTLETWRDQQIAILDDQLAAAQEQANAALGISDALLSVAAALGGLDTALGSLASFSGEQTRNQQRNHAIANQTGNVTALWDYEQAILGKSREDLTDWQRGVFESLRTQGFSGGGYTGAGSRSGGLDGEGGFLAMLHPRETVVDHHKGQTFGGDNWDVVQAVNALAQDLGARLERLEAHARETNINTGKSAHIQTDWHRNGSLEVKTA